MSISEGCPVCQGVYSANCRECARVSALVEAEREACAEMVESRHRKGWLKTASHHDRYCIPCRLAAAIRSRGEA